MIDDLYKDYEVLSTAEFKLTTKIGKNIRLLDLINDFGEVPELIAIERVVGKKNTFTFKAFVKKSNGTIEST